MDPETSPQPLASSSHQQLSSEHPTVATCPRHIDLKALHSRKSVKRSWDYKNTLFLSPGCTHEKIWPHQARAVRSSTPPNLSESDKKLVMALGLEEVYKRMAENHKFHIDVVRGVAAGQQSLKQADEVLCSMQKAAEHEYAHLMGQDLGMVESDEDKEEEVEEEESMESKECGHLALSQTASHLGHSPTDA